MSNEFKQKKVQVVVVAEKCLLLFEFNNEIPNNYVGFQNITGGVEGEESFEEAARRELMEEAGIESEVIDLNLEFKFMGRWKKECTEKVFLCALEKIPHIILNEEHLNYKWVPFEKVNPSDYTFSSNYEAYLSAKKYIEGKERK
jgi:8-oxo-dGTP pyrophosphatase MutT (NUDIX family)